MKMKRILATALTGAMALSMATTAFAAAGSVNRPLAETTESTFQVELEGMIYTPTIRVQVTESGSVYVNPSQSVIAGTMTKALDGVDNLEYSFEDQSVVSTPILIRSDTDKDLMVSATATATVPKTSGVTLVDKKTMTSITDKEIYLVVTGNASTSLGTAAELKGRQDTTDPANPVALPALDADNAIAGGTPGSTNKSAVALAAQADGKTFKGTAAEAATIDAAVQVKDSAGKITSVTPEYGVVMITGETAGKCNTWTESDIVNVSVALTFGLA